MKSYINNKNKTLFPESCFSLDRYKYKKINDKIKILNKEFQIFLDNNKNKSNKPKKNYYNFSINKLFRKLVSDSTKQIIKNYQKNFERNRKRFLSAKEIQKYRDKKIALLRLIRDKNQINNTHTNINTIKINNTHKIINDKNKRKKKKKWKISQTKQFENKIDIIFNPIKNYNPFIIEEFNFHKNIYKNKETNVEFPLPFDTYIRMKKHSQKILINYHRPSEMIFLYIFSEYFKIDYLSLRTITKLIEYHIEKFYK